MSGDSILAVVLHGGRSHEVLNLRRIGGLAVAAVTVATTTILSTGHASAASNWWSDPNSCTNVKTAVRKDFGGYTVEVRYGTCGGAQYGWGRVTNYGSGAYVRFEVDVDGDRAFDGYDLRYAPTRNYTSGYRTSSNSLRAFRACVVFSEKETCLYSGSTTAWW